MILDAKCPNVNLARIIVIFRTINHGWKMPFHRLKKSSTVVNGMHRKIGSHRSAVRICLMCQQKSNAPNTFMHRMKEIYKQRWIIRDHSWNLWNLWNCLINFSNNFQFNIHCKDNFKLALVGTIGNIARFIFLPITGLLSDR